MSDTPERLAALAVEATPVLTGSKTAMRVGAKLYVSPAMFDLLAHATPEELPRLLAAIPVLRLPPPPATFEAINY